MAITRTAMVDDDGSGTTGTIINNAWKTELYNQIDAVVAPTAVGQWTDVPFSAANFFSPTGGATWTVSAAAFSYATIGNVRLVTLSINGTGTTTGAPVHLIVRMPFAASRTAGTVFAYTVGASGIGLCRLLNAGTADIYLQRDVAGTPFGAATTYVDFQIVIAV